MLSKSPRYERRVFLRRAAALAGLALAAAAPRVLRAATEPAYKLAPESALAPDIRRAPEKVREAYRFAIANQETLRYIPCYCGCGADGHTSNASCYLKPESKPGSLVFDRMSLN
jgi:Protein of unknown function with PCYCGC motif